MLADVNSYHYSTWESGIFDQITLEKESADLQPNRIKLPAFNDLIKPAGNRPLGFDASKPEFGYYLIGFNAHDTVSGKDFIVEKYMKIWV